MLARKCGALPIKLYLFGRALFDFSTLLEGGALSRNYGFQFIWGPYFTCGSSALHLETFTFVVNYHISGFNGLTNRFTAFERVHIILFQAATPDYYLPITYCFIIQFIHATYFNCIYIIIIISYLKIIFIFVSPISCEN